MLVQDDVPLLIILHCEEVYKTTGTSNKVIWGDSYAHLWANSAYEFAWPINLNSKIQGAE